MEIVILDSYTLNPGDLSWQPLEVLGEVRRYDRTSYTDQVEIIERIGKAQAVLTNKTPITKEILEACPSVQYIGALATGYNVIDTEAARAKGIPVTNIPDYSTDAVSQLTFALILEIFSQVGLHNASVHAGEWQNSDDFCYWKTPLTELAGKTIGLIGYGAIAQSVAEIAHAFKMKVIYYNYRPKQAKEAWLKQVSLDDLYSQSDIISLHVPLLPETEKMIDASAIQEMKEGVVLINTSRGGLVDEQAVAAGLNTGKIAAFGADVVSAEPIKAENPLLNIPNCYLTPHIAWAPVEARQRLMEIAADNFRQFLAGQPQNVVNR